MKRLVVIGVIGGLIGAVLVSFPLWSPYFRTVEVNEDFPIEAASQPTAAPTATAVVQQSSTAQPTTPPEATTVTPLPATAEPTSAPLLVAEGNFIEIDAAHSGSGFARIYELDDGDRLVRLEDFRVTNGPALRVLLTSNHPTTTNGDLGEYVDLGALKGNEGNQNYFITPDVDLSLYNSVVIYCEPFSVVFSSAALPQTSQN